MSLRFNWTCQILVFVLILAPDVLGERRGFQQVANSPRSFSAPEQALFGTCTSDDCVLGPAQGRSYLLSDSFNQVDPTSSTTTHNGRLQDRTSVVQENDGEDDTEASQGTNHTNQGGFGLPSFVRPRQRRPVHPISLVQQHDDQKP